ncbi:MAG: hypothetical protein JNL51_04870 [Chitinophagaceae bacterium]|nr:hypothetical protein [Chitinophagaceae bacterium]
MAPTKILLVQLFSNGDCLYATAIAKQIKQDFPGCRLYWAISTACKSIIAGNPYVDETIEVSSVAKNDAPAYRRFIKQVNRDKRLGKWDEVFITHIMGANQANYDGSIRSAIFRGYGRPVTVGATMTLRLTEKEKENVRQFASNHKLSDFQNVILFEFAPQSGQSSITLSQALLIAEKLATRNDTAIILSSSRQIIHENNRIIDGSALTIRETAALTHSCSFLIGCSSGITWLSTSDEAKQLPMVQLLNPYTNWVNPPSRDFKRFGLNIRLIELIDFDIAKVAVCVNDALNDFENARRKYNQEIPLHFRTTRSIVYNLLCYLEFPAIWRHIRINSQTYGFNLSFYKETAMGFMIFPFKLAKNLFVKKVLKIQR